MSAQDKTHSTPLHLAAHSGSPDTVRLLIEHGADATVFDGSGRTPLHLASSLVSETPARCQLRMHGADVNAQLNVSAFRKELISKKKFEIVQLLIEHGMDVTTKDESLSTPLHLASSSGFLEIVRLLIESGADVTEKDGSSRTPLHLASSWVST